MDYAFGLKNMSNNSIPQIHNQIGEKVKPRHHNSKLDIDENIQAKNAHIVTIFKIVTIFSHTLK